MWDFWKPQWVAKCAVNIFLELMFCTVELFRTGISRMTWLESDHECKFTTHYLCLISQKWFDLFLSAVITDWTVQKHTAACVLLHRFQSVLKVETTIQNTCMCRPEAMKALWPGRDCEDLFRRKAWTKDRMMSMHQWVQLRTRIGSQVEEFGWKHCQKAATDLGLDPEQVSYREIQHIEQEIAEAHSDNEDYECGAMPIFTDKANLKPYVLRAVKKQRSYKFTVPTFDRSLNRKRRKVKQEIEPEEQNIKLEPTEWWLNCDKFKRTLWLTLKTLQKLTLCQNKLR